MMLKGEDEGRGGLIFTVIFTQDIHETFKLRIFLVPTLQLSCTNTSMFKSEVRKLHKHSI